VTATLILALAQADEVIWGSKNSCPSGYEKLTTAEACRAALDYVSVDGDEFNDEEDDGDWPSGCYYCDGTEDCSDGAWFNRATLGAAYDSAVSICGKAGWEAALDTTATLFVGDSDVDYWRNTRSLAPSSANVGYGGHTCEDVLDEFDATFAAFGAPATVVLVCGENDIAYGTSVSDAFGYFRDIVEAATGAGAKVVYLGTKPEPDTQSMHGEYEAYDALIRSLVADLAGPLVMIDVYPSFEAIGNPARLYADDDLHLADDGGYAYWNQWLATALADTSGCLRWLSDECVEGGGDDGEEEEAHDDRAPSPKPTSEEEKVEEDHEDEHHEEEEDAGHDGHDDSYGSYSYGSYSYGGSSSKKSSSSKIGHGGPVVAAVAVAAVVLLAVACACAGKLRAAAAKPPPAKGVSVAEELGLAPAEGVAVAGALVAGHEETTV